ncbi:terpene synthase family protein [Actinomadura macrotermitis]|uniref:Terpene synthase n=1 Tax=Actinomadura macrotermitis TaxID=2585200 RepID=A0A7K0BZH6_9ACTN|nr:terpene synthase family protein [Actinomadura macrotermitis]MQY06262.1 hypothetical protein [Actinomadura macrotermitis]
MAPSAQGPSEAGRPGALRTRLERDLRACMAEYPELFNAARFPDRPFRAIADLVARAVSAAGPGCTLEQLRVPARASMWVLAADALIHTQSVYLTEILAIVRRCMEVAHGAEPGPDDPLARFLADLYRETAATPAFAEPGPVGAALGSAWREELRRMLHAMACEWEWKALRGIVLATERDTGRDAVDRQVGGLPPVTLEEYLRIAPNMGTSWVNLTYWITVGDPRSLRHLPPLRRASELIQQILRLATDLASHRPGRLSTEVHALLLADAGVVRTRARDLSLEADQILGSLAAGCPRSVAYLRWQLDYGAGRYGAVPDYRGQLTY